MKHRVTIELYDYWNDLRRGRAAPERGDIDPAAIRSILADTFMLDIGPQSATAPDEGVIRLSGTRINAMFLRELKGVALTDLWRVDDRQTLRDVMACVLDERAAMVAAVTAAPLSRTPVDLELLLLPLRHHGRTHARVIGCLAPAWTASWLGLMPVEPMGLTSFRHVLASPRPVPSPARPAAGARTTPPPGPVRKGRFVVFEGGRRA